MKTILNRATSLYLEYSGFFWNSICDRRKKEHRKRCHQKRKWFSDRSWVRQKRNNIFFIIVYCHSSTLKYCTTVEETPRNVLQPKGFSWQFKTLLPSVHPKSPWSICHRRLDFLSVITFNLLIIITGLNVSVFSPSL